MTIYNTKTIKSVSVIVFLFFFIIAGCKNKKSENESINYLNKKYNNIIKKYPQDEVFVSFDSRKSPVVDESDFVYFQNIDNITVFHYCSCAITDKSIEYLKPLKNLERFTLSDSNLSDKGLQMISLNHSKLEVLDLNNTPVTSEGFKYIGKLNKLSELSLLGTNIDDEAVGYISELENMHILILMNTKITDKSIPHLMKLKKLSQLYITNTQITEEGYKTLGDYYKKNNLDVWIIWDPNDIPGGGGVDDKGR